MILNKTKAFETENIAQKNKFKDASITPTASDDEVEDPLILANSKRFKRPKKADDGIYDVEKILGSQVINNKIYYHIRWKGYPAYVIFKIMLYQKIIKYVFFK